MAADLVGGQALVDGVMIRQGQRWAAAVRTHDGTIATTTRVAAPALAPIRGIPFLRGMGALVDSLRVGMTAMSWSRAETEAASGGSPEGPSMRERVTVVAVVGAVLAAFVVLPLGAAALWTAVGGWSAAAPLIEGVVRLALFVAYLALISALPGIRTTLEYHGAEHMVVAGHEHGAPPTIAGTRAFDIRHPRCGTDLFLLIFVVSIVAFALVGELPAAWLVASRVLLTPVVVGVAYEILRAGGTVASPVAARLLSAPGLALQRFTTAEPSDEQIEVALSALDALLVARSNDRIPLGVD